jgi:hypothetical protein
MLPSVVKEPGCPSQNADRPTRRRARRWGDLSSPWGEELGQGPHGPGSFPPACTLLFFRYNESSLNSPGPPNWAVRPPIPVLWPATLGVRWSWNAMLSRPGLAAGHTPPFSATAMASGTAVGPLPVRREGESALTFIEPFVLHSSESRHRIPKTRSRVSMVFGREPSALLLRPSALAPFAPNVEPGTCGTRLPSSGEHVSKSA